MSAEQVLITDAKKKLDDILVEISWLEVARTYFGKSSSWLYQKIKGVKSDGSKGGGFTPTEAKQLQNALYDLSRRITAAADNLCN